jgi:hypothetical protein
MATFPSLAPSAAPIAPGAWPVSTINSLNGAESRIRQGSAQIGRRLQLTFTNVTESDFLAILAHYRGQRSGFDSFGFDTATLAADLTPAGYAWLYASRPQVVDEHMDVFTVQCEFKAEPRGLVVALGKAWRTGATTLTIGAREGGIVYGAGAAWTTSATTLTPGVRNSGVGSSGVAWATPETTLRPQGGVDPDFSSVSLLLHLEGTNGSTTFADSGPLGLSLTRTGSAAISTSQSAVGGSSLSVPDTSSGLNLPANAALTLSGDFTIEWRARHSNLTGKQQYFANLTGTNVQIAYQNGLFFYPPNVVRSLTMAVNTWAALAISRSGTTLYWFKDGALLGSVTDSSNYNLSQGMVSYQSGGIAGFMDEIRITKGVCRYTASYTVATGPFPDA